MNFFAIQNNHTHTQNDMMSASAFPKQSTTHIHTHTQPHFVAANQLLFVVGVSIGLQIPLSLPNRSLNYCIKYLRSYKKNI